MRRARRFVTWSLLAFLALWTAGAGAATVNMVNGIGLIDYASRPPIKVGSWIKYRMLGSSELGEKDDYMVTVMIAGEERFWGEECFWVETWTEMKGAPPKTVATLMSYDVFADSFPTLRSQYYMRKTIDGMGPDGELMENLVRRPASTLKKRGALFEPPSVRLDTLGTDTVSANGATFTCVKVHWQEGKSATLDQRDSSLTTEVTESRMQYFSSQIPVTGLAREDIERAVRRKTWAIGRSAEGSPFITMDRARGSARVVAFGEHEKSRLLPEFRQKSLAQWDAAAKPRTPATRPAARRKS